MLNIEPISLANVQAYKTARLTALKDAPTAYGSTFARESQLTDADWLKRAADWNGQRSIAFLATDAATVAGIVAATLNEHDAQKVNLYSMWVGPDRRRNGVGRLLINAVHAWAASKSATHILLTVTSVNTIAIDFYNRIGFSMTGNTEPYPNDPAIFEYEMSLPVAQ